MKKLKNIFSKYFIFFQVIFVLVVGVSSSLYMAKRVADTQKKALINRVEIISRTLHRTPLGSLKGNSEDLKNPDYNYLKKKMVEIKSVNRDARFVYLMGYRKDINKLFFIVDSELPGSNDYSPPGEVYEDSSDLEIENFVKGVAFAEGPYTDKWGRWVSVYSPVFSASTGLPIAIIGIDVSASQFISEVAYAGVFSLIVSILISMFLIIIYRVRLNNKNNQIYNIKMEFSSFMSHEIKGFITKMKGGLSSLYKEELGKLTLNQQTYIDSLFKESEEFALLIDDFLDISQLEQDVEVKIDKVNCNIIDVLKGVISDSSENIAKKDITIVYEGNVPEKIFLSCDSIKIGRVFSNILNNSIKYSPERSAIRIGYLESNLMHTIYFKDSGIGIPKGDQPKIFSKFYRAGNARGVHISGTGLGLYFSKLIVDKHEGNIRFESGEDRGTTFFVSLPKDK